MGDLDEHHQDGRRPREGELQRLVHRIPGLFVSIFNFDLNERMKQKKECSPIRTLGGKHMP